MDERDWDGSGYRLTRRYEDGAEVEGIRDFEIWDGAGGSRLVPAPRQFRHGLGTIVSALAARDFVIVGWWEDIGPGGDPAPGTWDHFRAFAPAHFSLHTTRGQGQA